MPTDGGDWWRPAPGSKAEQRVQFLGAALTIAGTSFTLAAVTWTLASTDDGRIKALLWWCIGVTGAGSFALYRGMRREHRETRYGRALGSLHQAHHLLRDAAYLRYIDRVRSDTWRSKVEESLVQFAASMSVATGAACHATIKVVVDETGPAGRARTSPAELLVRDFARSAPRSPTMRHGVPSNTVGRNSDYEHLFSPDADNRCWYSNDLLRLEPEVYKNTHWPERPTKRNVPYRSTMVWPIRKVLREGSTASPQELYVFGFLTVDSREPEVLDYERHFEMGACYADHVLSVVWDPQHLRTLGGMTPVEPATDDVRVAAPPSPAPQAEAARAADRVAEPPAPAQGPRPQRTEDQRDGAEGA